MYNIRLMNSGTEHDAVDDGILATPFEPREGMVYRFRERQNTLRATRYLIDRVEVDQVWGDTANGVAWVYVTKLNP